MLLHRSFATIDSILSVTPCSNTRQPMAAQGPFTLPPLPYPKDALAPHISKETVEFHYEKHHRGYLNKLNALVPGTPLEKMTLEQIVKTDKSKAFNLAAQTLNHTFYWNSMKPNGGGVPTGKIGDAINQSFGSFDKFKEVFTEAAAGHFGSGWAWLVRDASGKLEVIGTHDAGTPLTDGKIPILTCDVWEHAYYIDYRNDRPAYISSWWKVVNWQWAEQNLA